MLFCTCFDSPKILSHFLLVHFSSFAHKFSLNFLKIARINCNSSLCHTHCRLYGRERSLLKSMCVCSVQPIQIHFSISFLHVLCFCFPSPISFRQIAWFVLFSLSLLVCCVLRLRSHLFQFFSPILGEIRSKCVGPTLLFTSVYYTARCWCYYVFYRVVFRVLMFTRVVVPIKFTVCIFINPYTDQITKTFFSFLLFRIRCTNVQRKAKAIVMTTKHDGKTKYTNKTEIRIQKLKAKQRRGFDAFTSLPLNGRKKIWYVGNARARGKCFCVFASRWKFFVGSWENYLMVLRVYATCWKKNI